MSGFELTRTLNQTMKQAESALQRLIPAARKRAEAEARYRATIQRNIVQLKAEGHAATLIRDLARGMENACEAYVDRIIAEAEHESSREELMLRKKEIDVLRDALNREWSGGANR